MKKAILAIAVAYFLLIVGWSVYAALPIFWASATGYQSRGVTFSQLGTAYSSTNQSGVPQTNGTSVYCTDCSVGLNNVCAAGGTGSQAERVNGVWTCGLINAGIIGSVPDPMSLNLLQGIGVAPLITGFNTDMYVSVDAYGASGSNATFTGPLVGTTTVGVTTGDTSTFKTGHGVVIHHGSPTACTINSAACAAPAAASTPAVVLVAHCIIDVPAVNQPASCTGATIGTQTIQLPNWVADGATPVVPKGATTAVRYTYNQVPFTLTSGAPAIGQYASAAGTYTFNALNTLQAVDIYYVASAEYDWAANQAYTRGQPAILPTVNNAGGHYYQVSTPGISGAVAPAAWCQTAGCTTTDNTVVWTEVGTASHSMAIQVEALDGSGGVSPASTAVTLSSAFIKLPTFGRPLQYNWTAVTGAYGYVVLCTLDAGTQYICGATFGSANTTWDDFGTNGFSIENVPSTAVTAAGGLNDDLITSVVSSSVSGLVLANATCSASNSCVSPATIYHDDTTAIQAAQNFCTTNAAGGCVMLFRGANSAGTSPVYRASQITFPTASLSYRMTWLGQSGLTSFLSFWGDGGGYCDVSGGLSVNGNIVSPRGLTMSMEHLKIQVRNSMSSCVLNASAHFGEFNMGSDTSINGVQGTGSITTGMLWDGGGVISGAFSYFQEPIELSGNDNGFRLEPVSVTQVWPGGYLNPCIGYSRLAGSQNASLSTPGVLENCWNGMAPSNAGAGSAMLGFQVGSIYDGDTVAYALSSGSGGTSPQAQGTVLSAVGTGWEVRPGNFGGGTKTGGLGSEGMGMVWGMGAVTGRLTVHDLTTPGCWFGIISDSPLYAFNNSFTFLTTGNVAIRARGFTNVIDNNRIVINTAATGTTGYLLGCKGDDTTAVANTNGVLNFSSNEGSGPATLYTICGGATNNWRVNQNGRNACATSTAMSTATPAAAVLTNNCVTASSRCHASDQTAATALRLLAPTTGSVTVNGPAAGGGGGDVVVLDCN